MVAMREAAAATSYLHATERSAERESRSRQVTGGSGMG